MVRSHGKDLVSPLAGHSHPARDGDMQEQDCVTEGEVKGMGNVT